MKKVVILNKRTGKKTIVSEEKAKRIMDNPILNPFGRSVLVISKEDTIDKVPVEIKEQSIKKQAIKKEESNEKQNTNINE